MKKQVSPGLFWLLIIVVVVIAGLLLYRATGLKIRGGRLNRQQELTAAKGWIEVPVVMRLGQQGLPPDEVRRQLDAMWKEGKLKLPPGEPGVDWSAGPRGIIRLNPGSETKGSP